MKTLIKVMLEDSIFLCNTRNIEGIISGSRQANEYLTNYVTKINKIFDIRLGEVISKDYEDLALVTDITYSYFDKYEHECDEYFDDEVVEKCITLRVSTYDKLLELTNSIDIKG